MIKRPQQPVEVILLKQLASHLATPIFVVDPEGNLLYFNEPAEDILGRRYDETGQLPVAEWSTIFTPVDDEGNPLPADALPLVRALQDGEPAHGPMWITGLDGKERHISVTAFPLIGQYDRNLGAVAVLTSGMNVRPR